MTDTQLLQNNPTTEYPDRPHKPTTESLWKVGDVALFLRLAPETVRLMARQSKIPSIKMGRTYRFRSEDIKMWLESHITADHLLGQ